MEIILINLINGVTAFHAVYISVQINVAQDLIYNTSSYIYSKISMILFSN